MDRQKVMFLVLGGLFQIVSFVASWEGVAKILVSNSILSFCFALAINLGLLAVWHEYYSPDEEKAEGGFGKRRGTALICGLVLLAASAVLSTIGMYSTLGFRTGAEADSVAELNDKLEKTKSVFEKVKAAAAAKMAAEKTEAEKKLAEADRKLARASKPERRRMLAADVETRRKAVSGVSERQETLRAAVPISTPDGDTKARISAIQGQISALVAEHQIKREEVLSLEEVQILTFDAPIKADLFHQLVRDFSTGKPLAWISLGFGVLPDLLAVGMVLLGIPRRKLWRLIRDLKAWRAAVAFEFALPARPVAYTLFDVLVNDDQNNPLISFEMPLDPNIEIGEEHVRSFFPAIIDQLREYYGRAYEIRRLPPDWQAALQAGEALVLTANSV